MAAAAAPPPPAETAVAPASFVVEKIVVTGVRHSSEKIVAAETLLALGGSYTELQLQEALQRVERLPFVVKADFSLRRGSERGRFELAITVTETKPIFFGGSFDLYREFHRYRDDWTLEGGGPSLGARVFFAGQSELSAGLTGGGYSETEGSFVLFNVAYTHHNLFGRHIAGSVFLDSRRFGVQEIGTELALPLNRANVLKLDVRHSRFRSQLSLPGYEYEYRSTTNRVSVAWNRDTTDDPFTPRRGARTSALVSYGDMNIWVRARSLLFPIDFDSEPATGTSQRDILSASLQGSRYWPLSRRLSLGFEASLGGRFGHEHGTVTRADTILPKRLDDWHTDIAVQAVLLGTFPERRAGLTQFWWKVAATVSDSGSWSYCDTHTTCAGGDFQTNNGMLSASVAARGRWGTVALALHYRHYFGSRFE